jgi:hypothetical protein
VSPLLHDASPSLFLKDFTCRSEMLKYKCGQLNLINGQSVIAVGEKETWKNVIMIICSKYTPAEKMPG